METNTEQIIAATHVDWSEDTNSQEGFEVEADTNLIENLHEQISDVSLYFDDSTKRSVTLSEVLGLKKVQGAQQFNPSVAGLTRNQSIKKFRDFDKPQMTLSNDEAVTLLDAYKVKTIASSEVSKFLFPKLVTLSGDDMEVVFGSDRVDKATEFVAGYPGLKLCNLWLGSSLSEFIRDPTLRANASYTSYNPTYRVMSRDVRFTSVLDRLAVQSIQGKLTKNFSDLRAACFDIYSNTYLGSGSPQGQLGRHNEVRKVVEKINLSSQTKGVTNRTFLSEDQFTRVMNDRYPLRRVEYGLYTDLDKTLGQETDVPLTSVNWVSASGPMWRYSNKGFKKCETVLQDNKLASDILNYLKDLGSNRVPENLVNMLRVVQMAPKAEVYNRTDFTKKTRNIFVTNTPAYTIATVLLKPTHYKTPSILDHPTSWSLVGLTLFRGNTHRIIQKFKSDPNFVAVYSDNVYARDGNFWVSLDGEKMESCVKPIHVAQEAYRSLSHFKGSSEAWKKFCREVLPIMVADPVAVFGNQLIPLGYMASGAQGTSYFNQVRSTQFAHEMTQSKLKSFPLRMKEANIVSGTSFKEETRVDMSQNHEVLNIDLLGFSCVNLRTLRLSSDDLYVPVLQKDRILKALLYDKLSSEKKVVAGAQSLVLKLVKYRTLYLIGGWYWRPLDLALRVLCREVMQSLMDSHVDIGGSLLKDAIEEMLQDEVMKDNFDKVTLSAMTAREVPTLYDVFKLSLSTEQLKVLLTENSSISHLWASETNLREYVDLGVPITSKSALSILGPSRDQTEGVSSAQDEDVDDRVPLPIPSRQKLQTRPMASRDPMAGSVLHGTRKWNLLSPDQRSFVVQRIRDFLRTSFTMIRDYWFYQTTEVKTTPRRLVMVYESPPNETIVSGIDKSILPISMHLSSILRVPLAAVYNAVLALLKDLVAFTHREKLNSFLDKNASVLSSGQAVELNVFNPYLKIDKRFEALPILPATLALEFFQDVAAWEGENKNKINANPEGRFSNKNYLSAVSTAREKLDSSLAPVGTELSNPEGIILKAPPVEELRDLDQTNQEEDVATSSSSQSKPARSRWLGWDSEDEWAQAKKFGLSNKQMLKESYLDRKEEREQRAEFFYENTYLGRYLRYDLGA